MEEVDRIILHTLRQVGCDIDEEITSIKSFDSDMIVNSAVRCLDIIKPGLNLPHSLPPNMAAKYRVGQEIAQACIDLGYSGEIGYQTFLYSGESDIRKVLMFLVERLPKEEETFMHEPSGPELLLKKIKCKVKEEITRPWLPHSLNMNRAPQDFEPLCEIDTLPSQAWRRFWRHDLPLEAIDNKHLLPTVVTLHSRGVLVKYDHKSFISKKPTLSDTARGFPKDIAVKKRKPPLAPKPKPRISVLKSDIDSQESVALSEQDNQRDRQEKEVEELQITIEKLKVKCQQLSSELSKDEDLLREEAGKNAVRAKILALLPDGENNLKILQGAVDDSAIKLVDLAQQWEKHRLPLITTYRDCILQHSSKQNESSQKAETARSLSERRRELEIELKNKEQLLEQLQTESERIGKEANRSAYTRRILEIIGNIDKQKLEIEKVLKDTQSVQKEINNLTGQLGRSFTLADETIFADAKRDETSRKAYKLLATLHSDCDQLVAMVQETGSILREIRDLEEQIDKEKSKDVAANLERITADLSQMKQESSHLAAQLKLKEGNAAPS